MSGTQESWVGGSLSSKEEYPSSYYTFFSRPGGEERSREGCLLERESSRVMEENRCRPLPSF